MVGKKSRRRRFLREESWRLVRVGSSWRKPKGGTSRMRRSFSGWPRLVKVGYRRMKEKRGLQAAAKREINVRNRRELEHLSSEKHVVRIAHTVGERKRREILVKATEMGLKVIASRRLLPTSTGQVVAEEDLNYTAQSLFFCKI